MELHVYGDQKRDDNQFKHYGAANLNLLQCVFIARTLERKTYGAYHFSRKACRVLKLEY